MATFAERSRLGRKGCTHPSWKACSVSVFSTAPIVTVPCPLRSKTQLPSHRRSCGQIRPQISGKALIALKRSHASRHSPSAHSMSQSGMSLPTGQKVWQKGTAHCSQRDDCRSQSRLSNGASISKKSCLRSTALRASGKCCDRSTNLCMLGRIVLLSFLSRSSPLHLPRGLSNRVARCRFFQQAIRTTEDIMTCLGTRVKKKAIW